MREEMRVKADESIDCNDTSSLVEPYGYPRHLFLVY
jgi:hypothetical protein